MSELGDSYEYADSYLDQDDLSDGGSENTDSKVGADKRAHHNALERKRRDHIKDSFSSLRDSVPLLHGEKINSHKASRAQILKKAAEYIDHMRRKNTSHQKDIDLLRKENKLLEDKIRELEGLKASTSISNNTAKVCAGKFNEPTIAQSTATAALTVQAVIPAQVKVINAKGIAKSIQVHGPIRMRNASLSESGGSGGTSLLNNNHIRIKSESSSSSSSSSYSNESTTAAHSDSEYSELNETQVQIVKTDHKLSATTARTSSMTLLQQPVITLAAKSIVYKQPASNHNNKSQSLLGPPAKRKRMAESGVTIIAANVGQLVGK